MHILRLTIPSVVGCWLLLAGFATSCCWQLAVGCRLLLVVCCWMLLASGLWLAVGWLFAGCWLAVGWLFAGCWLLPVSASSWPHPMLLLMP